MRKAAAWVKHKCKFATEFWGSAGSGILFVCREDAESGPGGSALLVLRSQEVEQPGTWGVPGGAIQGTEGIKDEEEGEEFPDDVTWDSAMREVAEELGYFPAKFRVEGRTNFRKGNFTFVTYVVDVPLEERKRISEAARLDWENDDMQWVPYAQLEGMEGLHFGVQHTVRTYQPALTS